MAKTRKEIAMRVSWNTIIGNILLAAFKMIAGITGHSSAMISDAVHSISDVLSTFVVMLCIKMSRKQSDKEHPYGHERFECIAAIILAGVLFITGLGIGISGIQRIMESANENILIPGKIALFAAMISLIVKEGMYWYTKLAAKKIDSSALMADAWHHRSDALSSIGSLVGIMGARMGYPVLDSVACIVICLFIVKAAVDIFSDAVNKVTDRACDEVLHKEMYALIIGQIGVEKIDVLKTRLFGDRIYVDVEISADRNITLYEGHEIAHRVHDIVEERFPKIKHCMVHVNPFEEQNLVL